MRDSRLGAVETFGLVKVFDGNRVLDGVDLRVPAGSVYGLLGPNGAGKTTLVRILATLLRPDGGTARVFGHDTVTEPGTVRRLVGLTGQYASLDDELTGRENLVFLARLLGYRTAAARERAALLLDAFELTAAADRQVKRYSGGMRRRLDIAASVLRTPDLLVLDEPTTGLDPRSRNQVHDVVRTIVEAGTTVLMTTQDLGEADRLAGRIAVVDHGRVIAEDTPAGLKASFGGGTCRVRLGDPGQRPVAARVLAGVLGSAVEVDTDPAALTGRVGAGRPAAEQAARALAALAEAGVVLDDFAFGRPSLDQVFLALTSRDRPVAEEVPA
ncbi:ATP-binding cassette domain-containing protein [Actinoplanes sp. NPDC023801]|uniref:ATP-binding cassette domain-containing protein n=1 Tax=Actinoplanes sp. NPDC023801 TaxID=3154595 RepID=UPI0033CBC7CD